MTDTPKETEGTEPAEPTLAQVAEIAEKAAQAAAEAKTMAEAKRDVAKAVEDESERQGVTISKEDAQQIGDAIIAGMEARGIFADEASQTPPAGPPESNPPTPGPASSEPPSQSEPSSPGTTPASPAPSMQTPPDENQPSGGDKDHTPRKRTFAERFVGRN